MPVAAIAFTQAPADQNPNIRPSSHRDAQAVYFEAMELAFASVARWGDDTALELVSDAPPPPAYAERLAALGVEVVLTEFTHRPPPGFFAMFNASLFSLDAMRALAERHPDDDIALLDPDALAVRPLAALFTHTDTAIGVYPTGILPTEHANGLSAVEAAELHRLLDPTLTGVPEHFGGECYVFRAETIGPVLERAEAAFELAMQRHSEGLSKFTTEEHLLNYALRRARLSRLDDRVRRIWTAPRLRDVTPDLDAMVVWHLPAEKDRGFVALRPALHDRSSWFWTADAETYRRELGRAFGIPRRQPRRWAYDTAGGTVRRVQARLRQR